MPLGLGSEVGAIGTSGGSQLDRSLQYTDIFGYGARGTGALSTHLNIMGQIASHFRAGASAKRTRDLLVDQGTRTAEAEARINEVILKTRPDVALHADQRLLLQRNITDTSLLAMAYMVRGYYGRPSNEIALAMVEWGYTTNRVARILGLVSATLDQWQRSIRRSDAFGIGDIVSLSAGSTVIAPFGVIVGRTPTHEWHVNTFPGWNMWTNMRQHIKRDGDAQTMRRLARNPSSQPYRGERDEAFGAEVTLNTGPGFGTGGSFGGGTGVFPTLGQWRTTNMTVLVHRFGTRETAARPAYWDSLVLALYNESVANHVRVLTAVVPHTVHGASDTPNTMHGGEGEEGHVTPHPQIPAHHYTVLTQTLMDHNMLLLVRLDHYTDAELAAQWLGFNYDPAMTAIAIRHAHDTVDAEARAAPPVHVPTYGETGWVYTVISQADLDARTIRLMDAGRTAEHIRGTNRATNFDPVHVDLAITRATATLATARQTAADAAHVPTYGEAGFSYRTIGQADLNARATVLLATHSEAQARNILRSSDYSQEQIDLAFAPEPEDEAPRRLAEVEDETEEDTPDTADTCPVGTRRRLVEAGEETSCVRTGDPLQERPEAPAKAAEAGTPFVLVAVAGIVAVLAFKNM